MKTRKRLNEYISNRIIEEEADFECRINDWGIDIIINFIEELIINDRKKQERLIDEARLKSFDIGYEDGYGDASVGLPKRKDLHK